MVRSGCAGADDRGDALVQYLDSLQSQSGLPVGTTAGEFLTWDGTSWQLVLPRLVVPCSRPATTMLERMSWMKTSASCLMNVGCVADRRG